MLMSAVTRSGRDWDVLLLGGNGGSGKTTLALALARDQRVDVVQVDDIRLALQQYDLNEPALRFFIDDTVWERPPEELRDALIAVAARLEPALEVIVGHHAATAIPVILEGDGLHPSFMKRMETRFPGRVKGMLVVERDADRLMARMTARGRGFHERSDEQRRAQVVTSQLYGDWLRHEGARLRLTVIDPGATEDVREGSMATVFLLCGLPGSGKTTLARQIERERRAVRLAPDEWIAALFGPDIQHRDPDTFVGPARERTEALQRELAGRLLSLGVDVILENGFWGRNERDEYRAWAHGLGAHVVLRYLEVSREELWRRLQRRNAALSPGTFRVERHELDRWFDHFEAPAVEELALSDG